MDLDAKLKQAETVAEHLELVADQIVSPALIRGLVAEVRALRQRLESTEEREQFYRANCLDAQEGCRTLLDRVAELEKRA